MPSELLGPSCSHEYCWECLAAWDLIILRGDEILGHGAGHKEGCYFRTSGRGPTRIFGTTLESALSGDECDDSGSEDYEDDSSEDDDDSDSDHSDDEDDEDDEDDSDDSDEDDEDDEIPTLVTVTAGRWVSQAQR